MAGTVSGSQAAPRTEPGHRLDSPLQLNYIKQGNQRCKEHMTQTKLQDHKPRLMQNNEISDIVASTGLYQLLALICAPVHALGVGEQELDFLQDYRKVRIHIKI